VSTFRIFQEVRVKMMLLLAAVCLAPQESWVNPLKNPVAGVESRTFASASMKREVGYTIYLPPAYRTGDQRYPVVYYLHGMSDCESTHPQLFGILDQAISKGEVKPMILVYTMCGRTSWYADAPDGSVMGETVFLKELIPHVDSTYRTAASAEGRALIGWSMGGHGALKFGLSRPDLFRSVVSLGGGFLKGEDLAKRNGDLLKTMFGDAGRFDEQSPWTLVMKGEVKVALRLAVGTKDFLLEPNRKMKALLEEQKVPFEYEEIDAVGHEPPKVFAAQGLQAFKFHAARLKP
jgi:enterochelin esterase-like enzyme